MKHKKAEDEIIDILNRNNVFSGGNIVKHNKDYSRFDAYNKECIVEIKDRKSNDNFKSYNDLQIEFDKYAFNKEFARLKNVNFYYVNRYKGNIIIFDITNLADTDYSFKWRWEDHNKTTEFKMTEKISKLVGYIDIKCAWHIIPLK